MAASPKKLTQPVSESRAGEAAKKLPQAVAEAPCLSRLEKKAANAGSTLMGLGHGNRIGGFEITNCDLKWER
jgi:hypothetical protein